MKTWECRKCCETDEPDTMCVFSMEIDDEQKTPWFISRNYCPISCTNTVNDADWRETGGQGKAFQLALEVLKRAIEEAKFPVELEESFKLLGWEVESADAEGVRLKNTEGLTVLIGSHDVLTLHQKMNRVLTDNKKDGETG